MGIQYWEGGFEQYSIAWCIQGTIKRIKWLERKMQIEAKWKMRLDWHLTVQRFEFYSEDMGVPYVRNVNHKCFGAMGLHEKCMVQIGKKESHKVGGDGIMQALHSC